MFLMSEVPPYRLTPAGECRVSQKHIFKKKRTRQAAGGSQATYNTPPSRIARRLRGGGYCVPSRQFESLCSLHSEVDNLLGGVDSCKKELAGSAVDHDTFIKKTSKVNFLTQFTLGPHAVQIWSRKPRNLRQRNPQSPPCGTEPPLRAFRF